MIVWASARYSSRFSSGSAATWQVLRSSTRASPRRSGRTGRCRRALTARSVTSPWCCSSWRQHLCPCGAEGSRRAHRGSGRVAREPQPDRKALVDSRLVVPIRGVEVRDGVADVREVPLGFCDRALVAEGAEPAAADEVGGVRGVRVAGEDGHAYFFRVMSSGTVISLARLRGRSVVGRCAAVWIGGARLHVSSRGRRRRPRVAAPGPCERAGAARSRWW